MDLKSKRQGKPKILRPRGRKDFSGQTKTGATSTIVEYNDELGERWLTQTKQS